MIEVATPRFHREADPDASSSAPSSITLPEACARDPRLPEQNDRFLSAAKKTLADKKEFHHRGNEWREEKNINEDERRWTG